MSKIQIWKQFSTHKASPREYFRSVLPCQRYKFESNSQRAVVWWNWTISRFYHVKDTNLKAILNAPCIARYLERVGFTMSKIQIWKQFSTKNDRGWPSASRFYHVKDTNLKAILNHAIGRCAAFIVGFTMSKIQIWKQFSTPCLETHE